ncbi:MAG: aminomethyl-transferring glycine dehydrogenase subunit GcvPA [Rhodospirillales bacterium]
MRYLPLTDGDRRQMMEVIGCDTIDDLFKDVPEKATPKSPINLPGHSSEMEVESAFNAMAMKNLTTSCAPSFLGAGAYRHHVPAAVDHLIQRSEFLTAYTPYQPEISQGTLQYLFEFQTQVAMITGMEAANASMYDGATSCSEAVLMAGRVTRRDKTIVSGGLHPHYRDVTATASRFLGKEVLLTDPDHNGKEDLTGLVDGDTSSVVVQYPDFFGRIRDLTPLAKACHEAGALLVVAVCEPVSLGLIKPPGGMGADIVAAEGQSLGNPLSYGGPTVGLMATLNKFLRQMPGRLVGESLDTDGKRGYVLTLSTREQHIRRDKATSNICTNSGLCALAFTIHLSLLGEEGFAKLARLNHAKAVELASRLLAIDGVEMLNETFFNEFTVRLNRPAEQVVEDLAGKGILGGVPVSRLYPQSDDLDRLLLVAATETVSQSDMEALTKGLEEALS